MSEEKTKLSGPDLTQGVEVSTIPDGTMLLGHAQGEPVLLARRGDEVFAIGAICTHYGAPLEQGLLDGDTVRCQWHHACFSLRTGEALRAPALDPVSHWRVEHWHCREPSWRGLINSWCKSPSYNGIIRARSNSTPARPYMARLRVFSLLICPSVCPLLQGSDIAFRTASRSWRIAFAKRCIA